MERVGALVAVGEDSINEAAYSSATTELDAAEKRAAGIRDTLAGLRKLRESLAVDEAREVSESREAQITAFHAVVGQAIIEYDEAALACATALRRVIALQEIGESAHVLTSPALRAVGVKHGFLRRRRVLRSGITTSVPTWNKHSATLRRRALPSGNACSNWGSTWFHSSTHDDENRER